MWQWKEGDFEFENIIGEGISGKVYAAHETKFKSNSLVAIKALPKIDEKMNSMLSDIRDEIQIQYKLRGLEHVVQLYGIFSNNSYVYLILEYAPLGSLRQLMERTKKFSLGESAKIICHLVKTVMQLHEKDIIHRDLKPENLLIGADSKIKIADFGSSAKLDAIKKNRTSFVGTPSYAAPEFLVGKREHNKPCDIWSLGVLLYEFLVGKRPFDQSLSQDTNITDEHVMKGVYQCPVDMDHKAKDLISKMLEKDVSKRISLEDILKHEFITTNITMGKRCDRNVKSVVLC
jgi:serine/threonine protein kinase